MNRSLHVHGGRRSPTERHTFGIRQRPTSCLAGLACAFVALSAQIAIARPIDSTVNWRPRLLWMTTTDAVSRRVVKQFDFDERRLQNYERMPRNWLRLSRPDYPTHNEPSFDMDVGNPAAPSLRLSFDHGGAGAWYRAKDIPVLQGDYYRIVARVRTEGIHRARAFVSGFYLDDSLQKIDDSLRRGDEIRDAECSGEWVETVIDLPPAPGHARWLGLSCEIRQPDRMAPSPSDPRPIHHQDIRGDAWFDDIRISRIPMTELSLITPGLESAGNVFDATEPIEARVRVVDPEGADLSSSLVIRDQRGKTILHRMIRSVPLDGPAQAFPLDVPQLGMFEAELIVRDDHSILVRQVRRFLRVGPIPESGGNHASAFGLVLDDGAAKDPAIVRRLHRLSGAGVVKVPIWTENTSDQMIVYGDRAWDDALRALASDGVGIIGVLSSPPQSLLRRPDDTRRSLVDLLTSGPAQWRPCLTLPLTRYGDLIRDWQILADNDRSMPSPGDLANALRAVRTEAAPLVNKLRLSVPVQPRTLAEATRLPADALSLVLSGDLSSGSLTDYLSEFARTTGRAKWTVVQRADPRRYAVHARLADFARRMLTARAASDCVFVSQPWMNPSDKSEAMPFEEFAFLATLSRHLGSFATVSAVWTGSEAAALLFHKEGTDVGALAVWATGDGTQVACAIPSESPTTVFDLWDNGEEIAAADGAVSFHVDASPTIVAPVSLRDVQLQSGFRIDGDALSATIDRQERSLRMANPGPLPIHGRLQLRAPPGVRIEPSAIMLDIAPGREFVTPVIFRVATNAPTGEFVLDARYVPAEAGARELGLRTPIRIDCPDLDVSVLSSVEGSNLRIVQRVTNRSNRPLRLRADLLAPNLPRQTARMPLLEPGESVTREFNLQDADGWGDGSVRVSVREIDGQAVQNHIVRVRGPR